MKGLYILFGRICYWLARPLYRLILPFFPRAYVLIEAEEKFLVLRNWLGKGEWSLPGGGRKRGERPIDAVLRETAEETGIKLNPDSVVFLTSDSVKTDLATKKYHLYTTKLDNSITIKYPPKEITDADWKSREEMGKIKLSPETKIALKLRNNLL